MLSGVQLTQTGIQTIDQFVCVFLLKHQRRSYLQDVAIASFFTDEDSLFTHEFKQVECLIRGG